MANTQKRINMPIIIAIPILIIFIIFITSDIRSAGDPLYSKTRQSTKVESQNKVDENFNPEIESQTMKIKIEKPRIQEAYVAPTIEEEIIVETNNGFVLESKATERETSPETSEEIIVEEEILETRPNEPIIEAEVSTEPESSVESTTDSNNIENIENVIDGTNTEEIVPENLDENNVE